MVVKQRGRLEDAACDGVKLIGQTKAGEQLENPGTMQPSLWMDATVLHSPKDFSRYGSMGNSVGNPSSPAAEMWKLGQNSPDPDGPGLLRKFAAPKTGRRP